MLHFGLRATGARNRRAIHYPEAGVTAVKGEWMESGDDPDSSPTIFLVEQPREQVLQAHFHRNNQFQLFVEGEGRLGGRAIQPITVHYAGAYTAYGPISTDETLKYFTIRTVHEQGGVFVSESEDRWPPGPRRHATGKPFDPMSLDALRDLDATIISNVIDPTEDGLASQLISLPPESDVPRLEIGAGDGLFLFILSGDLIVQASKQGKPEERRELGPWESLYAKRTEILPPLRSGNSGAQLLTLVPPPRDPAYDGHH